MFVSFFLSSFLFLFFHFARLFVSEFQRYSHTAHNVCLCTVAPKPISTYFVISYLDHNLSLTFTQCKVSRFHFQCRIFNEKKKNEMELKFEIASGDIFYLDTIKRKGTIQLKCNLKLRQLQKNSIEFETLAAHEHEHK